MLNDEETHNYRALTKLVLYSGIRLIIEQNFSNHCLIFEDCNYGYGYFMGLKSWYKSLKQESQGGNIKQQVPN